MGKASRDKGKRGEREVAKRLNEAFADAHYRTTGEVMTPDQYPFQRNQNQSAIGGSDLSNALGLSIEVKFHEALSVNAWWAQCLDQAKRENGRPVLIYRKSRMPWRVMLFAAVARSDSAQAYMRIEIELDDFLQLILP